MLEHGVIQNRYPAIRKMTSLEGFGSGVAG
jgi:hypothetical protein